MLIDLSEKEVIWIKDEIFNSFECNYKNLPDTFYSSFLLDEPFDRFDLSEEEVIFLQFFGKKLIKTLEE
jgi:hypothetical protein